MKTPLAWRNVTNNKRRLVLALLGIAFVVLLMFMETGFLNGFMDSMIAVYQNINADLVIINKNRNPISPDRFARGRLYQACAWPAVARVVPMYIFPKADWKVPGTGDLRSIRIFAFDCRERAFRSPQFADLSELLEHGTVLFDTESRDLFGKPVVGTTAELSGRNVRVAAFAPIGIDLDTDGNLIMDAESYFAIFAAAGNSPDEVDIGLIQLTPGSDVIEAQARIRAVLPDDVAVLTVEEYVATITKYWNDNGAIAFLFNLGVFMGFIIGVIVCYQILFTDITSNLMPFATLKAMGFRNWYLVKVVLQQASLLALLGFVIGLIGTQFLYRFLKWSTGFPTNLTFGRATEILCLTLVMCLFAGLIAIRKVIKADPADCF